MSATGIKQINADFGIFYGNVTCLSDINVSGLSVFNNLVSGTINSNLNALSTYSNLNIENLKSTSTTILGYINGFSTNTQLSINNLNATSTTIFNNLNSFSNSAQLSINNLNATSTTIFNNLNTFSTNTITLINNKTNFNNLLISGASTFLSTLNISGATTINNSLNVVSNIITSGISIFNLNTTTTTIFNNLNSFSNNAQLQINNLFTTKQNNLTIQNPFILSSNSNLSLKYDSSTLQIDGSGNLKAIATSQWITSGSDIYYNSGNVGIGISNPKRRLQLHAATDIGVYLQITNLLTGTAVDNGCFFGMDATDLNLVVGNTNNADIYFRISGNNRMRIKNNGLVGIENNNPIGTLCIGDSSVVNSDGNIVIGKCTAVGTSRHYKIGIDSSYNFCIGDYGANNTAGTWQNNQLCINYSTGNVGVGVVPSTTYKLNINGSLNSTSLYVATRIIQDHLFNNSGRTHTAYTDFNTPTDFGCHFIQGTANSPSVNGAGQYYSFSLGIGNEYYNGGPNSNYKAQIAIPRNVSSPYICIRYMEAGTWTGWNRISAGVSDTTITSYRLRPYINEWHVSNDGKNRFYFGNNSRTYYGSQDGHEWRNAADGNIMYLNNGGSLGIQNNSPLGTLSLGDSSVALSEGSLVIHQKNNSGGTRHYKIAYDGSFWTTIGDFGNSNIAGTWSHQWSMYYGAPTNACYINGAGGMYIAGTLTQNSDQIIKTNIKTIQNALWKVQQLRGVEYTHIIEGTRNIGLIAQEVEFIIPEVVSIGERNNIKGVNYQNLVALLINAIKEQQDEINFIKNILKKNNLI